MAADLKIPDEPGYVYWSHLPADFLDSVFDKDNDPEVIFTEGKGLRWAFDSAQGAGHLTQQGRQFVMHGYKKTPGLAYAGGNGALDFTGLDAGRNLSLRSEGGKGVGQITLQDSVNQGAGSLTFHNSYVVSPKPTRPGWAAASTSGKAPPWSGASTAWPGTTCTRSAPAP